MYAIRSYYGNLHLATCDGALCYLGFEFKGYREEMYEWLAKYLKIFEIRTEHGEHESVITSYSIHYTKLYEGPMYLKLKRSETAKTGIMEKQ